MVPSEVALVKAMIRRLSGFALLPLLTALSPLLVLPVIARIGGPELWASVTTAQAIGALAGTVASFGWYVSGPPKIVAAADASEKARIYALSLGMRLPLVISLFGVALVTIQPLLRAAHVESALMLASTTFVGLTMSWFAIGEGRPGLIAAYELIPRLIATGISLPAVILTGWVGWYPISVIVLGLAGLVVFHRSQFGRSWPAFPGIDELRIGFRENRAPALIDILGAAYSSSPMPVATATQTLSSAATMASAEKVYRYSLFSVVALANALQGWVLSSAQSQRPRRERLAFGAHVTLGVCGGLGIALLGPWISAFLFGDKVAASFFTTLWLGVAFLAVSSSTPLIRNVLVPAKKAHGVVVATATGAIVGVPCMLVLAHAHGVAGLAAGLATSEMVILAMLIIATRRLRGRIL